jgi:hypothetical protein
MEQRHLFPLESQDSSIWEVTDDISRIRKQSKVSVQSLICMFQTVFHYLCVSEAVKYGRTFIVHVIYTYCSWFFNWISKSK